MDRLFEQLQSAVKIASIQARGESIGRRKSKNLSKPSAAWTVPSRIGSTHGTALSIVLSSIGCTHARNNGGCTMCSYLLDGSNRNPTEAEYMLQFHEAMSKLDKHTTPISVKIYTSGSFLDSEEVSVSTRRQILNSISHDERVKEVVLESRPEYVTESVLTEIRSILGDRHVELGIGLESSSDIVRALCINKNFNFESFATSVKLAKKFGIGTRAYVLLKPPFLTEKSALLDSLKTVSDALALGVTTISLNPVNVQRNTLVEDLWEKGKFRPPWLWSVVEVLRHAHKIAGESANIVCDPVAAGKSRGTHNCGNCDISVVDAIRRFSIDQDVREFEGLSCDCKALWSHVCDHEDVSYHIHT